MTGRVASVPSILAVIRRRRPILAGATHATLFRRLATVGGALVLVLLSCGREPTAPQTRDVAPRFARGFSFNTVFPQLAGNSAFADLVDFNRVHIVLRRAGGSVALDTTGAFPPGGGGPRARASRRGRRARPGSRERGAEAVTGNAPDARTRR